MTVSEIHIGLGILLQKVNTHKSKNFLPQELDMLFNLTQSNYKNKKTDLISNPKQVSLFDTHTSLDNLASLFETETLYPISTNQGEAVILLPFDFYGWINASANLAYDCPGTAVETANGTQYTEVVIGNLKDINLTTLSNFVISLLYSKKNETVDTKVIFDYSLLPTDYMPQDGVKDYQRSFIFINAVLKVIQSNLEKINPNAFSKIYIKYDNKTGNLILSSYRSIAITIASNSVIQTVNVEQQLAPKLAIAVPLSSPITVSDTEYEPYINGSHLSRSRDSELRAVRTDKQVRVRIPKNIVLSSIRLTYIRLPRQIDYLLGIGSDLPDDVITKVMADTAQLIKGIIATDSYDKFARENLLIE